VGRKRGETKETFWKEFSTSLLRVLPVQYHGKEMKETSLAFTFPMFPLTAVVDSRRTYYNTNRRHSSLGYVPPLTYIEWVRTGLAQGSSPGIGARYQERLRQWLVQLAVARKPQKESRPTEGRESLKDLGFSQ
jgi:hypothetical protein